MKGRERESESERDSERRLVCKEESVRLCVCERECKREGDLLADAPRPVLGVVLPVGAFVLGVLVAGAPLLRPRHLDPRVALVLAVLPPPQLVPRPVAGAALAGHKDALGGAVSGGEGERRHTATGRRERERERERMCVCRKRHSASHLIGFQAVTSNKKVFVNRERERERGGG